jgi:hypothetical protein
MKGKEQQPYQVHLGEKELVNLYRFSKGTVVYLKGRQSAVLREPVYGKKTEEKIRGLTAYIATSRLDLYYNTRFWSEPEGSIFTAYSSKARKVGR